MHDCWLRKSTGMFHSHTLNDLSSDVDTNRRFLIHEQGNFHFTWQYFPSVKVKTCRQRWSCWLPPSAYHILARYPQTWKMSIIYQLNISSYLVSQHTILLLLVPATMRCWRASLGLNLAQKAIFLFENLPHTCPVSVSHILMYLNIRGRWRSSGRGGVKKIWMIQHNFSYVIVSGSFV